MRLLALLGTTMLVACTSGQSVNSPAATDTKPLLLKSQFWRDADTGNAQTIAINTTRGGEPVSGITCALESNAYTMRVATPASPELPTLLADPGTLHINCNGVETTLQPVIVNADDRIIDPSAADGVLNGLVTLRKPRNYQGEVTIDLPTTAQ